MQLEPGGAGAERAGQREDGPQLEALGQRPARKWKLIVEKLEEEVSKKPERAAALAAALGAMPVT